MKRVFGFLACILFLFGCARAEQWFRLPRSRYELALPDRLAYSAPEEGDEGVEAWISDTLEVDIFAMTREEAETLTGLGESLQETAETLTGLGREAEVREVAGIEMLCLRTVDEADGAPCIGYIFIEGEYVIEIEFWYATPEAGEETAAIISSIRTAE